MQHKRVIMFASVSSLAKAHPATQALSGAAAPEDLNEGESRRNPGEPNADQARAGRYNKPRIEWRGLTLAIENPAGSVRRGRNRHGVTWEVRMRFDYGEILGSMGVDGDPVDVIVGPNLDAPMVYVVHQRKVNRWDEYDEDKCCVGFDSQADAEQAFLSNYNDPRFLGPITAMPVDEFVRKVRATRDAPAMIKAAEPVVLFLKGHVGPYLRGGKVVNLAGYQGRQARAAAGHGQLSLFARPSVVMGPNRYKDKHPVRDTRDLFEDEPQHTEPTRELIEEHERLVGVLNSPSHADDKVEAKKQAAELVGYKREASLPKPNGAEFGTLYHGSPVAFDEFNGPEQQRGTGSGYDHQGSAVYLTDDPNGYARFFAGNSARLRVKLIREGKDAEARAIRDSDGHVMSVKLSDDAKILHLDQASAEVKDLFKQAGTPGPNQRDAGAKLRAAVTGMGYDGLAFEEPNGPEGWELKHDAQTVAVYNRDKLKITGNKPAEDYQLASGWSDKRREAARRPS